VVLGLTFAVWKLVRFFQHLSSTLTASFGAEGRARILKRSVVRERKEKDEIFVVVLFEVTPDDGRPSFVDQETLFVGQVALDKLAPGNVVRVRFDRAGEHVFPTKPLTVLTP